MRSIMGKAQRICDPIVWNATPFGNQPDGRILPSAERDCSVFIFLGTGENPCLPRLWTDQRIRKSKRLTHADKLALAQSELEGAAEALLWHGPYLLDDSMKALLSVDVSQSSAKGADVDDVTEKGRDPDLHLSGDTTE